KQAATKNIFSEEFLIRRPLLRALENSRPEPPVLLIDEVDRADEEFEAYLLEVLADFAITIPEIGTIQAPPGRPPHVIITSNRTREVHDALKRRCLYHWIDYPSAERELAILGTRRPELERPLAAELVAFVQRLRAADLTKVPGIAETIDCPAALSAHPDQTRRFAAVLALLGFDRRGDVKAAGRAVFVRRSEERAVYDAVFDLFWRPSTARGAVASALPRLRQRERGPGDVSF